MDVSVSITNQNAGRKYSTCISTSTWGNLKTIHFDNVFVSIVWAAFKLHFVSTPHVSSLLEDEKNLTDSLSQ